MPESEKEPKEIVPGKGDRGGRPVPGASLSVNKHGESLLLEYAQSCENCCIFFLFSPPLTLFLPVLPWLVELPQCGGGEGGRLSHPEATQREASGAALLTVTREDVPVGGGEPHAPRTAQPQCLQLGGLGPATVTGGAEGLLEDSAEGHQGLRA